MADLSKPSETHSYIADWQGYRNHRTAQWHLQHAARNMRGALDSCEAAHRWPSAWNPDDVRESVRLLEVAIAGHESVLPCSAKCCTR